MSTASWGSSEYSFNSVAPHLIHAFRTSHHDDYKKVLFGVSKSAYFIVSCEQLSKIFQKDLLQNKASRSCM